MQKKSEDTRIAPPFALNPALPSLLLPWYEAFARDLPWRRTTEPYAVWLSEVMLQQTRVETVIPYYLRFLLAAPAIRDLAGLDDNRLHKLWEGLGYYTRARNLRRAAQVIEADHGGVFPDSFEKILSLPGIGPYTAAAVASICFGAPTPAVDGNVLRVAARLAASGMDIASAAARNAVTDALARIFPATGRGAFTQSLMELGATICLPNGAPRCGICPCETICAARARGETARYPVKSPKKNRTEQDVTVLLLVCDGKIAIRRRPPNGLLANMWELPNLPGALSALEAREAARGFGASPLLVVGSRRKKHVFTHVTWHMTAHEIACAGETSEEEGWTWATKQELAERYGLPTAFRQFLLQLDDV